MKEYPCLAEVSVWFEGQLRTVATLRQKIRSDHVSLYVHLGPQRSQFIMSYHASGQFNSKFTNMNGTVLRRVGRSELSSGKTRIELWNSENLGKIKNIETRLISQGIFLKTETFADYDKCQFKPEVIFPVYRSQKTLGLSFYPMTRSNKYMPTPPSNMAFGYIDSTLPPVFVMANYSDNDELKLAERKNYDDPVFDKIPRVSFSQVLNKGLFPVICHPNFRKPEGMVINVLNEKHAPSIELMKAYESLRSRPWKVDFPLIQGDESNIT